MYLKSLSLSHYKNLTQSDLDFVPKINCFLGNNGEGKTNLIDAIYYLSFCKSYTNSIDSQCINHDEDYFVISGEYQRKEATEKIYCALQRKRTKQFKRNKKKYAKLSEHIGLLPSVMLSPIDSRLLLDGSDERRKYMDGVISQFDKQYLSTLIAHNKILSQRNTYLKQGFSRFFDEELMEVWDEQLNKLGDEIFKKREEFIKALTPVFQKYYSFISGDREKVMLTYRSDRSTQDYLHALRSARQRDLALGYTTQGIHKDDLSFMLEDYPIKRLGSQGQQKTYLTALKFAQYDFISKRSGITPILLLDDIFDKLDSKRVEKIVELVSGEEFGQIFISDTNREHLYDILEKIGKTYRVFFVENGDVTAHEKAQKNRP